MEYHHFIFLHHKLSTQHFEFNHIKTKQEIQRCKSGCFQMMLLVLLFSDNFKSELAAEAHIGLNAYITKHRTCPKPDWTKTSQESSLAGNSKCPLSNVLKGSSRNYAHLSSSRNPYNRHFYSKVIFFECRNIIHRPNFVPFSNLCSMSCCSCIYPDVCTG